MGYGFAVSLVLLLLSLISIRIVTVSGSVYHPNQDGTFTIFNSTLFNNRPLYGNHNGGLILTGDRPIIHFANDRIMFGGFLFGIVITSVSGSTFGYWSFEMNNLTSTYDAGSFRWSINDSRLPGVQITAQVLPVVNDFGGVVDMNITTDSQYINPTTIKTVNFVWAYGGGNVPSSGNPLGWAYDPFINSEVLTWNFSSADCLNNHPTLVSNNTFILNFGTSGDQITIDLAMTNSANNNSVSNNFMIINASTWEDITNLNPSNPPVPPSIASYSPASRYPSSASSSLVSPFLTRLRAGGTASASGFFGSYTLPVPGANLWLQASSLLSILSNNQPVSYWPDSSGQVSNVSQINPSQRPIFHTNGLGPSQPALEFDGSTTFLANNISSIGTESTMFAVFQDNGSSGGSGSCCSGIVFFTDSFNGIATLPAQSNTDDDDHHAEPGTPIVTKLDYAGSPANGHLNIRGRIVAAMSQYTSSGPSNFWVDGCSQGSVAIGGSAGTGVMIGTRNNELDRFFKGLIAEIVVFPRVLNATEISLMQNYFLTTYPSMPPKDHCIQDGLLTVGTVSLPIPSEGLTGNRLTYSFQSGGTSMDPLVQLSNAQERVSTLTSTTVITVPDPLVQAAFRSMSTAVDGLFRDNPGVFVHGAMAWDVPYVGWRSEYGGTVFGRNDLVASEGTYFFGQQVQESNNTVCLSDPNKWYTSESPSSRFYGSGHIPTDAGMYDMQTQMFDQQIHYWRWTGNTTHEPLLRHALQLHGEWADDCFDGDGNGLYLSYINTWPTDSQWYRGETVEETAYMYSTHKALRDMAVRAGNATDAQYHQEIMDTIITAFPQLWVTTEGHPGANLEDGGHHRLRSDAWLYSIFVPIEAGILTFEQTAGALYFTEWGLEWDTIFCGDNATDGPYVACGEVVWTSNWVPSMWSVRQLWPGDNYALAMAYFFAGLPDDGYTILQGNLNRDMINSGIPGQAGAFNGGTDFNDCVHPLSRSIVEGLFGYHPNYPMHQVILSPQFPSTWNNASIVMQNSFQMTYVTVPGVSTRLQVSITQSLQYLEIQVPVRAQGIGSVNVSNLPTGASYNTTVHVGYGQSVCVIHLYGLNEVTFTNIGIEVMFVNPLPYSPSIPYNISSSNGSSITLSLPSELQTLQIVNVSDPQGTFVPGSIEISPNKLSVTGTLASPTGYYLVFIYVQTKTGLPQVLLYKLNITSADTSEWNAWSLSLRSDEIANASWVYIPMAPLYNADVNTMFARGTYLSPRPETCAVRIGSDGWSAWSFYYWGGPGAPSPDYAYLSNISIGNGIIATSQGAQFIVNNTIGTPNILFATLWDNYPSIVNVTVPTNSLPNATMVWVLISGSTNPMQTLIPNAVLRFRYTDNNVEEINLVPPFNFWSLAGWGRNDYDYGTDGFCLPDIPPPTVQLGNNHRGMVYGHSLRTGSTLNTVELEVVSLEVVIGIVAVSLMG